MKRNQRNGFRADLTLCLGESLFEELALARIEGLLREEASSWASDIHIWREGDKDPRRDIKNFVADVRGVALERGELYEDLIKRHGPGLSERRTGSVELRGADDSLTVLLTLDDYRFAPSAGRWLWGNTVNVQVCAPHITGGDAVDFLRSFAVRACTRLSPWYGHAEHVGEWDQKNISRDGGSMMAIGVDASRYLPGLYWLNFFGEPYSTLIGKERLLNAPAHQTEELDAGVLLLLASDPRAWETSEYKASERRVLMHLGDKYFFRPHELQRETLAPDFGLEPLPRNPRFT